LEVFLTREEHIAIYCSNCGNCVVCNENIAAASNSYFDRNLVREFCEIRPGIFVLYSINSYTYTGKPSKGGVEFIGSLEDFAEAYRNRAPYVPRTKTAELVVKAKAVRGIDTSQLRITI
jgi:hypothetical protein